MGEQSAVALPAIAVIGAGIRGRMFAQAVAQNQNASLAAVCDPRAETRTAVAHRHQIPAFASVADLLAAGVPVTAAIIATPDFAHEEPALACLEHGADLMIEKPLTMSAESAHRLVDAAARHGRRIMTGFENRWHPTFRGMKAALSSPVKPTFVAQQYTLNDTRFVPTSMLRWAARSSPAWFLMPHTLDLAMWLSGATPTAVSAFGRRGDLTSSGIDTWDAITATFAMSDGSVVTLHSSWTLPQSLPRVFDFHGDVQTIDTFLRFDGTAEGVIRYTSDSTPDFLPGLAPIRPGEVSGPPVDMTNSFIDLLLGHPVDVPDATTGLEVTRAIEHVCQSLNSGDTVTIDQS